MATNGAEGAKPAVNGKQSPAGAVQPAGSPSMSGLAKQHHTHSLTNGDSNIPALGAYPTPNGVSPSSPVKTSLIASMEELPEEIQHITAQHVLFSDLITRVSEECFGSLDELITAMNRISIPALQSTINGASSTGIQQQPVLTTAEQKANHRKKMLMLDFASDFRAKFIKLLVVADWTKRDQSDVSKLIDLFNWFKAQETDFENPASFFYEQLRELRPFKLANPDIDTALAVLSKKDVPWIPHFGFRKEDKLHPREILETLQRMNTIINLRLVLHEEMTPQLKDYRIGDGRATFVFPEEFELDVYLASDDPESPWYFLDVRFLFEPAPQISGDRLLGVVDVTMNNILAKDGLRGACEFVHDFVLTHKIAILMRQARALQRGIWARTLRVEQIQRMLIIQYWMESPQSKSWIEIGVASGKDKSRRRRNDKAITSRVQVRWMKSGKAVEDAQVPLGLADLSVERLLNYYVARHTSGLLTTIYERLEALASTPGPNEHKILETALTTSNDEPQDCSLVARLGEHPAITMRIDGITGRAYFYPAGPATTQAQATLDKSKDPATDAPSYISRLLTYDLKLRIDALAESAGWDYFPEARMSADEIKSRTQREIQRHGFFQPPSFKGGHWYIAYTISLSGEYWWVMEINPTSTNSSTLATRMLPTIDQDGYQPPLTPELLNMLEQLAARTLSLHVTNKDLSEQQISTALKILPVISKPAPSTTANTIQPPRASEPRQQTLPNLMLRFSDLMRKGPSRFANELLQIQYLGFSTDVGQVKLVAKGSLRNPAKLQDVLERTKDPGVSFALNGSFSMVVPVKLGESCITKVVARLSTLGKLCDFAKTLKKSGYQCDEISFSKVCFKYAGSLEVSLSFVTTEQGERIKLSLAPDNPHARISALLEDIINEPSAGFGRFVMVLDFFLPILRAFQALDRKHVINYPRAPEIFPRQVDYYRIVYPNPSNPRDPHAVFDLNFKQNKDDLEWRVSDHTSPPARQERDKQFPGINEKIYGFMRRVGTGWTGMSSLVVATQNGIEEAILELDRCIWDAMQNSEAPKQNGTRGPKAASGPEVITID